MPNIYVKEQGACVRKESERICVTKNSQKLLECPVFHVDSLLIFGNVQITTQTIFFLISKGIDIIFFSFHGKYMGRVAGENSKNVFIKLAQYQIYNETDRKFIRKNLLKLEEKDTIQAIMGIEGICSASYFKGYEKLFLSEIRFEGRNRRPPRDPVNILLSLGYSFLLKDICGYLEKESLETYLGFLHGVKYGRDSLGLDMIELFRQPFIDKLILYLFNTYIFTEEDFQMQDDRVQLQENAFMKFCTEYEKFMNKADDHALLKRDLIQQAISALKNYITGSPILSF